MRARTTRPGSTRSVGATRSIHFESYIIHDDEVGEQFADALIAKARDGVAVRVIYDWMGGLEDLAPILDPIARGRRGRPVLQPAERRPVRSAGSAAITGRC